MHRLLRARCEPDCLVLHQRRDSISVKDLDGNTSASSCPPRSRMGAIMAALESNDDNDGTNNPGIHFKEICGSAREMEKNAPFSTGKKPVGVEALKHQNADQ